MKSASAGLIALLNSSTTFLMADLYTITLVGGTVLRFTGAEGGLTVAGNRFDGDTVLIERSKVRTTIGIEVDTLDLTIDALPTHTILGSSLLQSLKNGAFDGATVEVERCFMPAWGDTSLGTVILFVGVVADMDVGRTEAKIRVNSDLQLLNIQMPRNLYQPGCLNSTYDTACTQCKANYAVAGVVVGVQDATTFYHALGQPADWFTRGTVTFTSGENNGVARSIKQHTSSTITLMAPFVTAPAVGDTFLAYAGCAHTQAMCRDKFGNLPNFRGMPYIPVPESVT